MYNFYNAVMSYRRTHKKSGPSKVWRAYRRMSCVMNDDETVDIIGGDTMIAKLTPHGPMRLHLPDTPSALYLLNRIILTTVQCELCSTHGHRFLYSQNPEHVFTAFGINDLEMMANHRNPAQRFYEPGFYARGVRYGEPAPAHGTVAIPFRDGMWIDGLSIGRFNVNALPTAHMYSVTYGNELIGKPLVTKKRGISAALAEFWERYHAMNLADIPSVTEPFGLPRITRAETGESLTILY